MKTQTKPPSKTSYSLGFFNYLDTLSIGIVLTTKLICLLISMGFFVMYCGIVGGFIIKWLAR